MAVHRDRRDWDELAELDPYWAALTDESKREGDWDRSEFIASGRDEIDGLLRYADGLGVPRERRAALDFGCGPGRLTRALASHFESSVGVDASERMLREARALNADVGNCRFVLGGQALGEFADGTFDLVYSNLVLQHVSSRDAVLAYVSEFVRVLAPGGLLAFQVPSHLPAAQRVQPRRRLYHGLRLVGVRPGFLQRRLRLNPMILRAVPSDTVLATLDRAGAQLIRRDEETWPGGVRSATYFATKPPSG